MNSFTKVWINGDEVDQVDVTHRGFMYADGVFETIAVEGGKALLLDRHLVRLEHGMVRLGLVNALSSASSIMDIKADIEAVADYVPSHGQAVLKVVAARGPEGAKGYRPGVDASVDVVLTLTMWESSSASSQSLVKLALCQTRLGTKPALAGLKTLNALEYVLASRELTESDYEGVLLDDKEHLVEGTKSNVFWVTQHNEIQTPLLQTCGVEGVMKQELMDRAQDQGIHIQEVTASVDSLSEAKEIFICNSLIGLISVTEYQDRTFSSFPIASKLRALMKGACFETH